MVRKPLEPFFHAWQDSTNYLRDLRRQGQRFMGYFCSYTPIELLHAAGFTPIRLLGGAGPIEGAYRLVPDFICPYMRRCLEKALAGEFDYLTGVVQGYTCDAACGCLNIWEANFDGDLFYSLPLPYNDTPASRKFLRAALQDLAACLNRIGGHLTGSRLKESLRLYDQIRKQLAALYDPQTEKDLALSAAERLIIIMAGFVIPPEIFVEMLEELTGVLPEIADTHPPGIPVLVSGSLIENPDYLATIEACGGRIVTDDLCSGRRVCDPYESAAGDPFDVLVDRHMHRRPCPARSDASERSRQLAVQIETSGARGVIFIIQKYCSPHLADYPVLANALKAEGIPSIMIEVEENWHLSGQLQTRLEGFFEILGS